MRTPLVFLTVIVLTAATSPAAHAQPTPVAIQFQVNSYTTGDQTRPSVSMTPQGDFVVGFLDHYPYTGGQAGQDGSASTPCLKRFSTGAVPGFEVLANTYTAGDQTDI